MRLASNVIVRVWPLTWAGDLWQGFPIQADKSDGLFVKIILLIRGITKTTQIRDEINSNLPTKNIIDQNSDFEKNKNDLSNYEKQR